MVSIPLGWAASRWAGRAAILVPLAGVLYTIPSLALITLVPLLLGTKIIDPLNVQVPLAIYTIALLVRSVSDALLAVPGDVTAAATAIGYRPFRRFLRGGAAARDPGDRSPGCGWRRCRR